MRIITDPSRLGPGKRAVAIGAFDGVHRGHRKLLSEVVDQAALRGLESLALTFEPHPLRVLRPDLAPPLLTSFEEKAELLAASGVQTLVVHAFDEAFAATPPAEFITRYLHRELGAVLAMVGFNFSFGAGGQGTPQFLLEHGRAVGLEVEVIPALKCGGVTVSSSAIRRAVAQGDVEQAARLLGRPYGLKADVGHGDGRGATLGFPTANLAAPADRVIPANGVYVVGVSAGGLRWGGVANVGHRPTFGGGARGIEAHLLDYSGDLYGKPVEVAFLRRLRDEMTFRSADELRSQIAWDVRRAREALAAGLATFYNPPALC
ncbi:MAG: bifunctional riboflavin kinase/FAD synthetase [Bacillota bacterium]